MTNTVKTKKTRPVRVRATRKPVDRRDFPRYAPGMSTMDYVRAYHAANATVHLTEVDYVCT